MENKLISDVQQYIRKSYDLIGTITSNDALLNKICDVINICIKTVKSGNKIYLAGNGGSAADAQHIAAEFVSRFYFDRPGLGAVALTTDTSVITAIGNDYGFEFIFSRQIEALGSEGDLFIGYTTSGKSKNILNAMMAAKEKKMACVALTGEYINKVGEFADVVLNVASRETAKIQEVHAIIGHVICGMVEASLFKEKK
jgi:D-sedoheptulose 7-phosphate isomerase